MRSANHVEQKQVLHFKELKNLSNTESSLETLALSILDVFNKNFERNLLMYPSRNLYIENPDKFISFTFSKHLPFVRCIPPASKILQFVPKSIITIVRLLLQSNSVIANIR
jgi:hypothetical protein